MMKGQGEEEGLERAAVSVRKEGKGEGLVGLAGCVGERIHLLCFAFICLSRFLILEFSVS